MKTFLYASSEFEKKYFNNLRCRYPTMKIALNLFLQRNGKVIVETGCQRLAHDWGGGCSTLVFGEFCQEFGAELHTVDISEENLDVAKEETERFKTHIRYHQANSIDFLRDFDKQIDLLYLDSVDVDIVPNPVNEVARKHQLMELCYAMDKLHDGTIILLDDCNLIGGGKCTLTKEFLFANNYEMLFEHQQSVWVKKK